MRLIDADLVLEELSGFSMRITGTDNAAITTMKETKKSIAKMVDEQPTAYDVDKVVERLICESINCHIMTDRAVEIVKSGGIE